MRHRSGGGTGSASCFAGCLVLAMSCGLLPGSALTAQAEARSVAQDSAHLSVSGVGLTGPRHPVLLVPGWRDGAATMAPLEDLLRRAGWSDARVARVDFQDPVGSNREHAQEIADALEHLRARTGVDRVDVVAHSMGGLATRYLLQKGGGEGVRRVVFIATPHHGSWTAYLAWGEGGKEMHPGSLFLLDLQAFRAVPSGVEALTLRSKVDFHVLPPESGTLAGVPDVEICCPSHDGLLSHPEAFQAVHRFLTREDLPPSPKPGNGEVPREAPAGEGTRMPGA